MWEGKILGPLLLRNLARPELSSEVVVVIVVGGGGCSRPQYPPSNGS